MHIDSPGFVSHQQLHRHFFFFQKTTSEEHYRGWKVYESYEQAKQSLQPQFGLLCLVH